MSGSDETQASDPAWWCGRGHIVPTDGRACPECAPRAHLDSPAVRIVEARPGERVVGWLRGTDGLYTGCALALYEGTNTLGSAVECELPLADPYLRPRQTVIVCTRGLAEVADLHSAGGTHVNRRRIDRAVLRDGDSIRVGTMDFRFELTLQPNAGR